MNLSELLTQRKLYCLASYLTSLCHNPEMIIKLYNLFRFLYNNLINYLDYTLYFVFLLCYRSEMTNFRHIEPANITG